MDSDSDNEGGAEQALPQRARPNILVTGTPGTGKTTTCEMLAIVSGLRHIEVGKLVKEKQLHDGFDTEFQSFLINEDKVVDELEDIMADGGIIVDHHGCDFFPERWFDLVVVLTCSNDVLYSRLESRNYSTKKIQENVECEIMRVVADEAASSYKQERIVELASNTIQEMEDNVNQIEEWINQFVASRQESSS
eukprot:jgi/Hompol1/2912/HPOL_003064-RA